MFSMRIFVRWLSFCELLIRCLRWDDMRARCIKKTFVFLLQRFSLVVQEREYIRVRGSHLLFWNGSPSLQGVVFFCRKSQHEPGGPMSCAENYPTEVPRKDFFDMGSLLCRRGCLLLQEVPTWTWRSHVMCWRLSNRRAKERLVWNGNPSLQGGLSSFAGSPNMNLEVPCHVLKTIEHAQKCQGKIFPPTAYANGVFSPE